MPPEPSALTSHTFIVLFMSHFVHGYYCLPVAGQLKGAGASTGHSCVVLLLMVHLP